MIVFVRKYSALVTKYDFVFSVVTCGIVLVLKYVWLVTEYLVG